MADRTTYMSPKDLLETKPTVTVAEAATILSVSRARMYQMASDGDVRSIRLGQRRIVIPTEDLRRLIG